MLRWLARLCLRFALLIARAHAAFYLSCCVVGHVRWVPLELRCGGFRLSCWIRLCLARYRMFSVLSECTHRCVLELRHTTVSAFSVSRLLFGLYCAARVRLCGVMRSCVRSLCGWRALAVVHWKGGVYTAVSALVLLCC